MVRELVLIMFGWVLCLNAWAHEVRPAYLKITQTEPQNFFVIWKQPVLDGKRLKLSPKFPPGCELDNPVLQMSGSTVSESSSLSCDLTSGIIEISGLERTLTDVFIEVNYLNGETRRELVKPSNPRMDLGGKPENKVGDYMALGVEHILMGWDHIFFVIGLALLVSARQIWGVATSFTLAHSLTLALAAFGFLSVPSRPVEILIALSIVFLGIEVIKKLRGEDTLATRRPYLISFAIGLLHGCGFAGALSKIGLPKGTELMALLLFNLGIELGQFAIIAAFIVLLVTIARANVKFENRMRWVTTYLIAATAMYWVIDRVKDYWV